MRFKIVNKKIFTLFICVAVSIILGLSYGVYFLGKKIIEIKKGDGRKVVEISLENNKIKESKQDDSVTANISDQTVDKKISEVNAGDDVENNSNLSLVEYENQSFHYKVKFLESWQMNNDFSEAKIEKADGRGLSSGGQTFWSNYKDINKYNPSNKPDDFRLLSLVVYRDESKSIQDFAQKLGVRDISLESEIKGLNVSGYEYIYSTGDDKNPNITAIFNKDNYYYVFKPAFINGDSQSAEVMEDIVKSFSVL